MLVLLCSASVMEEDHSLQSDGSTYEKHRQTFFISMDDFALNGMPHNTIQYIENLYSAAIQKCPGALTILKYTKTKIKSICDECTLEQKCQKCLKPFLEYICIRAVLQVLR